MSTSKDLQLTETEQLKLQVILLRSQIENERISHLKTKLAMAHTAQSIIDTELSEWKDIYSNRVNRNRRVPVDVDYLDINAETGEVSITTPRQLRKAE